jgi:hypothetical protein
MKGIYRRWMVAALVLTAAGLPAQAGNPPRERPFGAGERAQYQVKLGGLSVGSGAIEVLGVQSLHGHPVYHTRMTVTGGVPLAHVDDRYESWIDTVGLYSRRFHQNQREVRYRRNRTFDFDPENRTWRRENGETGTLPTDRPLDDLSFLFYARTLPLQVGATYTLRQYFKESGNPVVLRVVRRDTVRVPAGTFRTIVVRPTIRTRGLFGEGGQAEVHFSDDERRILVMIRSRVPVVGSLSLHLRSYQPPQ